MFTLFRLTLSLCLVSISIFAYSFEDSTLVDGFSKGFAITADNNSLETAQKNPAAITYLEENQFSSTYTSYFDDMYQTYNMAYGMPIKNNYFIGFQLPSRIISDIKRTEADENNKGTQIGTYQDTTIESMVSLGINMTKKMK